MVAYLKGHCRYNTMNSWNRCTSYANCVKIHRLDLPAGLENRAYELLAVPDTFERTRDLMKQWSRGYDYEWQAGFNGRSDGYIVLYQGERKLSQYKSVCTTCGQRNYRRVMPLGDKPVDLVRQMVYRNGGNWTVDAYMEELTQLSRTAKMKFSELSSEQCRTIIIATQRDIKANGEVTLDAMCGRCGSETRENARSWDIITSGRGTDEDAEFDTWDLPMLKERVAIVLSFDRLCDEIRTDFIDLCKTYKVEEVEVMVPTKVKQLVPV